MTFMCWEFADFSYAGQIVEPTKPEAPTHRPVRGSLVTPENLELSGESFLGHQASRAIADVGCKPVDERR